MKEISWVEAKKQGLSKYFTGRPCKNGHIAARRVSGRQCVICANAAARTWAIQNPKRVKEISKKWSIANRNSETLRAKEWRKNNPAAYKKAVSSWRNKNAIYYKAYMAFAANQRRIAKLKATPLWLNQNQQEQIFCRYRVAAMYTAEGLGVWHVDHIVPLRGDDVCGLHVPWNLQVIPALANLRKGNSMPLDTRD